MNLFNDESANVMLIPKAIYIFIVLITLYFTIFTVAPILSIIEILAGCMDETGSLYIDVMGYFDAAVIGWYLMIVALVAVEFIHFALLAIKKQQYTGAINESDF